MKFRNITIPAEGRNKYGNYVSSTELTKSVVRVTYNGDNTTGGNNPKPPKEEPRDVYTLFLSKSTLRFDSKKLLDENITEVIDVLGFVNSRTGDTFVGKIDTMPSEDDVLRNNDYYDIIGLAEHGMSVSVLNNGTKETKIQITCTNEANENEVRGGTLVIPCSVYKKSGDESLGEYLDDWASEKDNCYTLYLEVQWQIPALPASNIYTLDLSNEMAGINCDSEGNIYANAVRPTCKATMYYGERELEGVQYSISTDEDRNAVGVSINTDTGELTFGSNFKFDGSTLEVRVTGNYDGARQTKIMTISKQYAGADGSNGADAVTRWVVPSVNVVKFNPNTNTLTPAKITCKVMKQVGEDAPVEDSSTKLYYGYDTTNPITEYSSEISIDASKGYIAFALKNASNVVYEIETIQILKEGQNGSNGSNGQDGQSVYKLTLTNDNASINADKDGNIYANAHKPTCTASLYYGAEKVSGVSYSISTNPTATGISINATTGVISLGDDFNFTGTSLEITVTAKVNNIIFGTAIMTISKAIAGQDGKDGADGADGADGSDGADGINGEDAVSYWLDLSTTEVVVAKGTTTASPSSITLKAYKQVGGNSPTEITSTGVIKWGYNTASPSTTSTTINSIDTGKTYIMVHLTVGGVIYDRQTISILKDGKDGKDGSDGTDGKDGIQGRQGAALRGPVDWKNQTTSRRWCNGTLTNASYPEDAEFIDIVVYNGTYYKCKTSYNGKGSESSAPSSTYWTATDKQYEFVSTNLLLADNAKIKFATNNELYLTDNSGNVTAGAAGGNGTSFWAGANEPTNAKFKVNYDGEMTATKGNFGLLSIGTDKWGDSMLSGSNKQTDGATSKLELTPQYLRLETKLTNGNTSDITIAPAPDPDTLGEGMNSKCIDINLYNTDQYAIWTNGGISASHYEEYTSNTSRLPIKSPFYNMEIAIICDSDKFTKSNGSWYWNGGQMAFRLATSVYPYVKQIGGQWCFCKTSTASTGVGSGIYTSSHTKQGNKLYIVV